MKTLPLFHFILYCAKSAILHPQTRIAYYHCSKCRSRFPGSLTACPKCGCRVDHSPERREDSPVPWYCSVLVIIIGVICWVLGAGLDITGLSEAGHALVFIPLGNLFGMSLHS